MPELSRFYDIIIRMFYGDHAPPHFHAVYQGEQVQINIETLAVMNGSMRRRALVLVLEWARCTGTNSVRLGSRPATIRSLPKSRLWTRVSAWFGLKQCNRLPGIV